MAPNLLLDPVANHLDCVLRQQCLRAQRITFDDELIQAQIGQLKALSESYAVKGEFAKVRELNDFATNASNVLNQLTNSGRGPSDPSYIALSEQLSLALMEISQELGLFVPSGPPDNTTANQTTINNSPYVNNP